MNLKGGGMDQKFVPKIAAGSKKCKHGGGGVNISEKSANVFYGSLFFDLFGLGYRSFISIGHKNQKPEN